MIRVLAKLLGGIGLVALPAALAAAQAEPPAPSSQDEEIVVQGYTQKQVRDVLWRAITSTDRVIARRSSPVCVGIDNAPAALADPLKARMEANFTALGIPVAPPGCKVNAIVVLHHDAHAFVKWLSQRDGGVVFGSLYLPQMRRLIKPVRPAYSWHFIAAEAAQRENTLNYAVLLPGQAPDTANAIGGIGGRILPLTNPVEISQSFTVVDTDAIDGLTIEQLGDYLTINALVEFKPDAGAQMPPDSILNLFTRTGSNPDAGPGLSKLDMAILSQSYATSGNYSVGAVRSRIAREAVRVLDKEGLIKQDAKP
jgi:hypothetical protein